MRFRHNNREIPELNTTSTADISFMLLVFFLVTSSMGADSGLSRKLAPIDNQTEERQDISRSNVLQVRIDADDRLYCDGQPVSQQQLRQQVESFVASRQTGRHVISVETDRATSYNAYFEMQNAIVAAYASLRDKAARHDYGRPFRQCSQEERDAVMARYPQRISEAIPVGGESRAGHETAARTDSKKGGGQ